MKILKHRVIVVVECLPQRFTGFVGRSACPGRHRQGDDVARRRRTSIRNLKRRLSGDLDWIVIGLPF